MKPNFSSIDSLVQIASFTTSLGAEEYYITLHSEEEVDFSKELETISHSYKKAIAQNNLSADTLIFSRFYVSDIANQQDLLRSSPVFQELCKGAVSVIQQCPVNDGNIHLLVYHVKTQEGSVTKNYFGYGEDARRNGVVIRGAHYELLWLANFYGNGGVNTFLQTAEIFTSFQNILERHHMTLLGNAIRTWVYVRDIDNHYKAMVEARKAFFTRCGLTSETRYLASTGIEGFSKEVDSFVALDAFAVGGLQTKQLERMQALDHLPPTIRYGVTFERGTRVRFGDRSHMHISGTASINADGHIMHAHDVKKQTQRTIENVKALLMLQGAELDNMAYIIAYVRNVKDKNKVSDVLQNELPAGIPLLLLEGAVCRPAWLVELEGVAITADDNPYPIFF